MVLLNAPHMPGSDSIAIETEQVCRMTMAKRSTVGSRLTPRSYSAPLSHRLHVNKVASYNLLYWSGL